MCRDLRLHPVSMMAGRAMVLRPKNSPSLDVSILFGRGKITVDVGGFTDGSTLCRDDVFHTMTMAVVAVTPSLAVVVVLFLYFRHLRVGSSRSDECEDVSLREEKPFRTVGSR
jgi:hypothetical protein